MFFDIWFFLQLAQAMILPGQSNALFIKVSSENLGSPQAGTRYSGRFRAAD
jgi:hypothetical protein